jgi:hypothetical protein
MSAVKLKISCLVVEDVLHIHKSKNIIEKYVKMLSNSVFLRWRKIVGRDPGLVLARLCQLLDSL